jgi:hypothetical protein
MNKTAGRNRTAPAGNRSGGYGGRSQRRREAATTDKCTTSRPVWQSPILALLEQARADEGSWLRAALFDGPHSLLAYEHALLKRQLRARLEASASGGAR